MKLSIIILSSIIALVPLNVLAQNNWARFPQWVKQRSNPPQFVQIGETVSFDHLVDKKLIPLGGDKYGFIFRKQMKRRLPHPGPEYTEIYIILDCKTGDYDVTGTLFGDNRGGLRYYPQCQGPDCFSSYPDEPEPKDVAIIQKNFCPKR